ncbi:hypothetical protein BOV90_09960 [Solemya velum gill symbiont]|uniref:Uncharacterized protein n=1 Tax=Solemya velum gill symbiont TaxID=2340 RepID=A0A1T2DJ88_SOVGS|nr:hypothetical protein BOV88_06175 [Solemya velum gill symbiont]OOY37880.1 hypothetical protein BOV89_05530 [Solemya velum gill symbiont]OOY39321.1 hypothetical protein BOV90_09960 [Solemya velum gill symbiont]OOY43893.1 hypothetical protein BOV91_02785 [Solemya velum gill symbiont]OOY46685.1 hypothetical protein BOV92_02745 [Solemya velum gill symbiont]
MIVSWQNKYIFVHSRKTAGSSIVVSLSRNLGPDDLVLSAIKEIVEAKIQLPDKVIQTALLEDKKSHNPTRLFNLCACIKRWG